MHKNSTKRIYLPGAIYFVTTVTYQRYPYFRNNWLCDLLVEELRIFKKIKGFKLFAFVIMPDHIHLLIEPNKNDTISDILHSLKRSFSRDVNAIAVGEVHEPRLRGEQCSFRLSQTFEIPKLIRYKERRLRGENIEKRVRQKFKWQKSFHDHIIRDEEDYYSHQTYILTNPQRHGIVDDWGTYPYSSTNPGFHDLVDEPMF